MEERKELLCATNTNDAALNALFQKVATLVRESHPSDDNNNDHDDQRNKNNNDEKLRLYGLYKFIQEGPCDNQKEATPSILQPVARAKFVAWKECSARTTSRSDAMIEYIETVSSRKDRLGQDCRMLWNEFQQAKSTAVYMEGKTSNNFTTKEATSSFTTPDESVSFDENNKSYEAEDCISPPELKILSPHRKGWGERCLRYLGGQPLIPRGRLDISNADLWFAIRQCLTMRQSKMEHDTLKRQIATVWSQSTNQPSESVVVGLSVRSLFDVYLTMKVYPEDSELIVVPPISVPGMMQVAKHHNLRIVPVDIDKGNGQWVDVNSVRSKISKRTVAVMIVHPFGMVTVDNDKFAQLRSIADTHGLEIWEDCAECFTGLGQSSEHSCYLGNQQYADVRYFSFGNIKTATALGGGLAILRDLQTAKEMVSLQYSFLATQQTSVEFFCRVLLALFLNFIADSPVRVGLLALSCRFCGLNFDSVVTHAVRGFRVSTTKYRTEHNRLIRQIRSRPSSALLALLKRRLEQSSTVASSIQERVLRCRRFECLLKQHIPAVDVPLLDTYQNTFWAFPICFTERKSISDMMKDLGFDVTTGASQLCSLSEYADDLDGRRSCPDTDRLMDSVLYIPIPSQVIPDVTMSDLTIALKYATKNASSSPRNVNGSKNVNITSWGIIVAILCTLTVLTPHSIVSFVQLAFSVLLLQRTVEVILLKTTAAFYLKESTAFIENCDMLEGRLKNSPHQHILSSISALHVCGSQGDSKRSVILTGATGLVGSSLLRDLLQYRDTLSLKHVYLICRSKGSLSAQERIKKLLSSFDFLPRTVIEGMIHAVEGDVSEENAGLSPMNLSTLVHDCSISHVFHCAASVSFTQELSEAARSNIASALNMQSLTARLKNKNVQFVHISTSFVHGDLTGSIDNPLPERLFDFGCFDPTEIFESMLTTQFYASKAMTELGFHNSYSFSKSVCEHLLARQSSVKTVIIRPCIVGPAAEAPFEGWAGDKPSTIVAGPCLHLSHQWNIWFLGRQHVSCIPVDVLARYILAKSFDAQPTADSTGNDAASSDGSFEHVSRISDPLSDFGEQSSSASSSDGNCHHLQIFNAAWSTNDSKSGVFTWLEFSVAYLHLGSVLGYFSRMSALLQLFVSAQVMPWLLRDNHNFFPLLHKTFIRSPLESYVSICARIGFSCHRVSKLLSFLDLPILFFPFMRKNFYFASELIAPKCFDAQRYSFSCGVAAHRFIASKSERTKPLYQSISCLCVGGADHKFGRPLLSWAFAQPNGSILVRIAAALFGLLLRNVASIVTVDVTSFRMHVQAARKCGRNTTLVLAPTHRSFMDFVLLSYVIFSIPELQIDIPFIIASNEFERLPMIGWLAHHLRAFYIQRDRETIDSKLPSRLGALKKGSSDVVIEVFIEGKRSRDRRFVRPKTGFLKSLKESGGHHVIVPIAISYERIPEQEILSDEASGGNRLGLNLSGMICWLFKAINGNVNLGKIHIAANNPVTMASESILDFDELVTEIQGKQQERVVVSDYHILAAAKFFCLSGEEMKGAMTNLGCNFWPDVGPTYLPALPHDASSLVSIFLQFGHCLAPLFGEDQKQIGLWLSRLAVKSEDLSPTLDLPTEVVRKRLEQYFASADMIVSQSIATLQERGFEEPCLDHVFQICRRLNSDDVPLPLLYAAASFKVPTLLEGPDLDEPRLYHGLQGQRCSRHEKLGFWGFDDSAFIARLDSGGRRYVTMKGNRYSLCGKKLSQVLPFMEKALEVKVDLSQEFGRPLTVQGMCPETELCSADQDHLSLMFGKRVTYSLVERARHGSGHSQEDVFLLRSGSKGRIPDAVVWPNSEDEVISLVNAAHTSGWCLIPYGGGTNVTSATRCPSKEKEPRPILSVDMTFMSRIIWVNEEDGLAHVESGIVGRDLMEKLEERGYTIGHEPDSIEFSTLGGWIATKASGMKRSKYGNIEDIVLSIRFVGPNGVLWKGNYDDGNAAPGRESEGMDVRCLAVGSEGCLGIITSAVVRIWPLPELKQYDSVLFPSFQDGLPFMRALSRQPLTMPACVRLLDNAHFRLGQALRPDEGSWFQAVTQVVTKIAAKTLLPGTYEPDSVVCATICYEGTSIEVKQQIRAVKALSRQYSGWMLGPKIGKAGYELTFMIAYLRDFAMTYHILGESFETFAPWSKIEVLIAATKARIQVEHSKRLLPGKPFVGCRVTQLYHEGACLYFYLCMSFAGVRNASHAFAELERAAREEILKHGGSLSHHHGLGKLRSSFLQDRTSSAFRCAAVSIKDALDKDNVFGARNGLFVAGSDET
ncbi:FAD binding oxidase [Nitzschia inconspicua]|uniref:alkylglycerone-phosphate synthase n=1 Tax=Nitzschia inconspicua TaxID=303405 RepID=A0A9K3M542_9STRA|nr:FAD binding oxidase [Nitzschia inconspicua]